MKKILLFALVALFSCGLYAQMTLEHTFNASPQFYGNNWKSIDYSKQSDVAYFMIINDQTNNIEYYDSNNFNLVRSMHVQIDDSFKIVTIQPLPTRLYKNDDKSYYFITYTAPTFSSTYMKLSVFKEENNNLVEEEVIATGYSVLASTIAFNGNKVLCLIFWRDGTNTSYYDIYSFVGNYSGNNQVQANSGSMIPYPNPSRDNIYLTFEEVKNVSSIRIFDVNGRMIERIPVGNGTTEFLLDVHSYPDGVYFYEIDGRTQSFMVK